MFRRAAAPAALIVLLPLLALAGSTGTAATAAPAPVAAPLSVAETRAATGNVSTLAAARLRKWAPRKVRPGAGPSFNNPFGGKAARRRNLERLIRYVNSTEGYRVNSQRQCPKRSSKYPNTIQIALYSFSDPRSADALIAAHRRCINVQVLMNNHLTNREVPAFGRLQKALGYKMKGRSWARRCKRGCRGTYGPLHTKMFLFTDVQGVDRVTMFGSSNLTGKAADVQWNDLTVIRSNRTFYDQFEKIFDEMKRDRRAPNPLARNYRAGRMLSMWWPQPGHTRKTDRVLNHLQSVRCGRRPTGGTGYAGRTGVAINMHAMEGERGLYLAKYIVRMKRAGCRVRVLYGLIAPRIHRVLKAGNVPRRRTIFDRDGNGWAEAYTHMKVVAVNGAIGKSTGDRVVYTGSENFSHRTVGADEVWVRMPFTSHWRKYQNLFDMIWRSDRYSHPKYAHYAQSDTPIHARQEPPRKGAILVTQEDLEG